MARELIPIRSAEQVRDEFKNLAKVLLTEKHDLPCALLGASYIDHCMAAILINRFVADSTTSQDLLQPGNVLGECSARSKLAYCLGLIQKSLFNEANKISEIRNKFAHGLFDISFKSTKIVELCDELGIGVVDEHGHQIEDARSRFTQSVIITATLLLGLALEINHVDKKSDGAYPHPISTPKPKLDPQPKKKK